MTAWFAALVISLTYCGDASTIDVSSSDQLPSPVDKGTIKEGQFAGCGTDPGPSLTHNWNDPPSHMVVVSSTQEAATHLAFTPRELQGLGVPDWIVVGGGPESARESRTVWFRYDAEPYGNIHVSMWLDPVPVATRVASWREWTAKTLIPDSCIRGTSEMVTIKGTTDANIGGPPDENRITINWREGSLWVQVSGPTLQRDDALAIAEKL